MPDKNVHQTVPADQFYLMRGDEEFTRGEHELSLFLPLEHMNLQTTPASAYGKRGG